MTLASRHDIRANLSKHLYLTFKSHIPNPTIVAMALGDDKKSGVSGATTAVTSTVGNGVGGLLGTVGGVVGAASRGGMDSPRLCL